MENLEKSPGHPHVQRVIKIMWTFLITFDVNTLAKTQWNYMVCKFLGLIFIVFFGISI